MADKTYRMTVRLSDGNTVDAGTFVAPQGPAGPQGPTGQQGASGAINDWTAATTTTVLSDGTYLIRLHSQEVTGIPVGIVEIQNGGSSYAVCGGSTGGELYLYMTVFKRGKIGSLSVATIGENKFYSDSYTLSSYDYIKLK